MINQRGEWYDDWYGQEQQRFPQNEAIPIRWQPWRHDAPDGYQLLIGVETKALPETLKNNAIESGTLQSPEDRVFGSNSSKSSGYGCYYELMEQKATHPESPCDCDSRDGMVGCPDKPGYCGKYCYKYSRRCAGGYYETHYCSPEYYETPKGWWDGKPIIPTGQPTIFSAPDRRSV